MGARAIAHTARGLPFKQMNQSNKGPSLLVDALRAEIKGLFREVLREEMAGQNGNQEPKLLYNERGGESFDCPRNVARPSGQAGYSPMRSNGPLRAVYREQPGGVYRKAEERDGTGHGSEAGEQTEARN